MKASEQYFSSKMVLKVKVLTDFHREDKFENYIQYLLNIKDCLEERIKHYTIQYCDAPFSGGNTRLQVIAKEEVSRLISIVSSKVSTVEESEIRPWLSTFCGDETLRCDLGVILKEESLWSDSDVTHEPDLKNFKQKVHEQLSELEKKLSASLDNIKYESETPSWKHKPHELLSNSVGCTEQCPFCGDQCDSLDPDHVASDRQHSTAIHRPGGLAQYRYTSSQVLVTEFCPARVSSDTTFKNADTYHKPHPYKDYEFVYPKWSIPPDTTTEVSMHWKWFACKYKDEIAQRFDAKSPEIPEDWFNIEWDEVKTDFKNLYHI